MKSALFGVILLMCITSIETRRAENDDDTVANTVHNSRKLNEYDNGDVARLMEDIRQGNQILQKRMKRRCPIGPWRWCRGHFLRNTSHHEKRAQAKKEENSLRALFSRYKKELSRNLLRH